MSNVISKPLEESTVLTYANTATPNEISSCDLNDDKPDTTETSDVNSATVSSVSNKNVNKRIYTISVDGIHMGYKNSHKAALRIVNRLKFHLLYNLGFQYPLKYAWNEFVGKHACQQRYVLESWPINDLTQYPQKEHEIVVTCYKYI